MSSYALTAGQVMDQAAVLYNDAAKSVATYVVQIPYLNMALKELQEIYQENNVPITDKVSALISIPAGTTSIPFGAGNPHLPDDLVEPVGVWESASGLNSYSPMPRLQFLPIYMSDVQISSFGGYVWAGQEIQVLSANRDNDIKIEYIRNLFNTIVASTDAINVINSITFLQYRTAALLSEFVGENKTRADDLNDFASASVDRSVRIGTKGRQAMVVRRRPFRSTYKNRGY